MSWLRIARLSALGLPVVAALAAPSLAQARRPERMAFDEYMREQKNLHNRRVLMHARLEALKPNYPEEAYGAKYFKANGLAPESHYLFAVTFDGQSRVWLFPAMDRNRDGAALWAALQQAKPGSKLSLIGRIKRMGDTGAHGYDPNRKRYGGGFAEVPSVLDVEAIEFGWVKPIDEYVHDLGRSDELVAETIPLLVQEGKAAVRELTKALADRHRGMKIRANAARALGAIGELSALGTLRLIASAEADEAVRTAAFAAMLRVRSVDALTLLGTLIQRDPADAWATVAAATLLESGSVELVQLQRAAGRHWKTVAPGIARGLKVRAEQAMERKQFVAAVASASGALVLDPDLGEMYLVRGKATLAIPDLDEAQRERGIDDLMHALKLGVGETAPLLQLARNALEQQRLLVADGLSRRLYDLRPTDPLMRKLRTDVLVQRARTALADGDRPAALTLAVAVLDLDPANSIAHTLKAQAEGKSVLLLNARRASMGGLSLLLAPRWMRAPNLVPRDDPDVTLVLAAQTRMFPGESIPPMCVFRARRNRGVGDQTTAQQHVERFAATRNMTILRRGSFTPPTGPAIPWIDFDCRYASNGVEGSALGTWAARVVDGDCLIVEITLDKRIADEHRPVALEMFASMRVGAEDK